MVLRVYLLLSYFLILLNSSSYLGFVTYPKEDAIWTCIFSIVVWLLYSVVYMIPSLLVLGLFRIFTKSKYVLYPLAVLLLGITEGFIFGDTFLFSIYNYHFNGFVWNLLTTPGGIESMGANSGTVLSFTLKISVWFIAHAVLLTIVIKWRALRDFLGKRVTLRFGVVFTGFFLVLMTVQSLVYGFSHFYLYPPIIRVGEKFLGYAPLTVSSLAKKLGLEAPPRTFRMGVSNKESTLTYPLNSIQRDTRHPKYNIVWLTAESLRGTQLTEAIMPETYRFSKEAAFFTNHYSGGNGTRMAMFSMFYGIYANYWFSFLNESRGPVLMDWLIEDQYQFGLFTSARFTYPEFDKTIFAKIPKNELHEDSEGLSWERDRRNVNRVIDFIEKRDQSRPFMAFLFFESPHAPYDFPPENAIHTPYLEDMNYAKMKLDKEHIGEIKNRYDNSCNHLDGQLAKIVNYLKEKGLMDNTIIIINGDHGEEFMEKGRWGHNSTYVEEQVKPPLIIWYPGIKPQVVTHLTSHLDIPATLARFMGVKNPPSDYSFGFDLFGDHIREYTVLGDWDSLCFVDDEYKGVLPVKMTSMLDQEITTKDDKPTDLDTFYSERIGELNQIMKELGRFNEK